jgi:hypothetical protein
VEQKVILHGVSWETYERLLADSADSHAAHFAYDQGMLEIMVLSFRHETLNRTLAMLVETLAEALDIDLIHAGSTTFKRVDLARGCATCVSGSVVAVQMSESRGIHRGLAPIYAYARVKCHVTFPECRKSRGATLEGDTRREVIVQSAPLCFTRSILDIEAHREDNLLGV